MSTTTTAIPTFELRHRLARALEVGQVTNEAMADEIGKGVTTIRNYLAGRTTPDRATLRVWALLCGVPFDWLAYGIAVIDAEDPDPTDTQGRPPRGWVTAAENRSFEPFVLAAVA